MQIGTLLTSAGLQNIPSAGKTGFVIPVPHVLMEPHGKENHIPVVSSETDHWPLSGCPATFDTLDANGAGDMQKEVL